jgi:hypothetical protein
MERIDINNLFGEIQPTASRGYEAPFSQLASELKQKIFMGKGFATNDTFAPEICAKFDVYFLSLEEGLRRYVQCMVQILMGI